MFSHDSTIWKIDISQEVIRVFHIVRPVRCSCNHLSARFKEAGTGQHEEVAGNGSLYTTDGQRINDKFGETQ